MSTNICRWSNLDDQIRYQPIAGFFQFEFTVKTDNTGTSDDDQFTIPLYSGETYDFTVAYDGQETTHNADTDLTITFPSGAGTYDVVITGTFAGIRFNNGGDKLKLTKVTQFGDIGWTSMAFAFYGCSNCTEFNGAITGASITALDRTWYACSSATSFPDVSTLTSVTTLNRTWFSCSSATSFPDVSALTSVTTISQAWRSCTGRTQAPPDLSHLDGTLIAVDLAFLDCSNMTGTSEEFWNYTTPPITTIDCYTGCTNLTDYATIPAAYGGGGA